jgi:hypothetical protein
LNSQLSVVVGPSRDGALGVIGVSGNASLTYLELYSVMIFINEIIENYPEIFINTRRSK